MILKFRLSWGQVGNDGIITSPRFTHLPVIDGNVATTNPKPFETQLQRYMVQSYPNSNIKWEIAEQSNLGVELKMFRDLFEANIDIYQEIRHNILDYRRTIPASMGLEALQLGNVGPGNLISSWQRSATFPVFSTASGHHEKSCSISSGVLK